MQTLFPTLGMIAVLALIWGGVFLIRKGDDRQKGWLMIVAALVLFANILILTWPVQSAS
jgi:predicted permease